MERSPNKSTWLAAVAIIILLNLLAYWNSLDAPFTFDDYRWIVGNSHVQVDDLSLDKISGLLLPSVEQRRSVASLSLAFNYRFSGFSVRGYHLFNLGLHISNAVLLLWIMSLMLRRFPQVKMPLFAATAATLIWSLQPVQTQAVTYIIQRMTSMATTFYLLSILAYLYARVNGNRLRPVLYSACALFGLLGILSKEIAATLPFFLLVIEYCFFKSQGDKDSPRRLIVLSVICAVLSIIAVLAIGPGVVSEMQERYSELWFSMGQRLMTQPRVVLYYPTLVLLPFLSRFRLEYDYQVSQSLFDPWVTLPALLIMVAIFGLGLYLMLSKSAGQRNGRVLTGFAIIWYLGQLFMESSFYPLDMAFEHRVYLPSIAPICLAVVWLLSDNKRNYLKVSFVAAAVIMLTFLTYQRNQVWTDSMTLARDTLKKSPANFRTFARVGELYINEARPDKSLKYYQQAVNLMPDDARMRFNLGWCLEKLGRLDQARDEYERALSLNEKVSRVHLHIAGVYNQLGLSDMSLEHYQRAIEIEPEFVMAHNNLGQWYSEREVFQKAEQEFRKALDINPLHPLALRNLGMLLIDTDRAAEALPYLMSAVEVNPTSSDPVFVLGLALTELNRFNEAAQAFHSAVTLTPEWTLAWYNLGEVLHALGDHKQAEIAFNNALKVISPSDIQLSADIRESLANIKPGFALDTDQ